MIRPDPHRLFILTGGPGTGKSTLLQALAARGIATMPEAGRAIIQDQLAIGGDALPWADRAQFAELMLNWELRSYRDAAAINEPILFDRGVPDVPAYLRLCGLPVPPHMLKAGQLFRYNPRVLVAPPWQQIFIQDRERKQNFAEAQATYDVLVDFYLSLDYELVPLPLAPVEEQAQFAMKMIGL
ncbi:MAG TPA: AAA family ATPase [Terracidiphilus sp.]|jgi:predicted ATPase